MFITDLRRDFYELILRQHVLVLSDIDVDAVCAFKILQFLFRCDHVSYTLIPVSGYTEFHQAINDHLGQTKNFILLNCGASLNFAETVDPPADATFFIIDSRRPFDVDGVYDGKQVRYVIKEGEEQELNIPSFADIYREGDDNDADESTEDLFASPSSKRPRVKDTYDSEQWEENRNRVLFDYYEFSYRSNSISMLMFELAWKLSKDNTNLLWWACVGATSQFLEGKINPSKYVLNSADVQQHLIRLSHAESNDSSNSDCLKLSSNEDLLLSLYRHWSLYDSLRNTVFTSCYFKSWTPRGRENLLTFLADIGIPLVQCRQRFNSMDAKLRKEVHGAIKGKLEKYNFKDLIYMSFAAQYSFTRKISAADAVHAVSAALFYNEKPTMNEFLTALDCLSKPHYSKLCKWIDQCKVFLQVLSEEVRMLLNTGHVVPHNSFLLTQIKAGTPGWYYFTKPSALITLGNFLLKAFGETSKGRKYKSKPMLLIIPTSMEDNEWSLIAGIPPPFTLVDGEKPVNCLGQAFQRVGERAHCHLRHDAFDANVVLLRTEDKLKFCDALSALLES